MGKADGLSRRADWKVGTDKDNENQVFIKNHWIHNMYEVVVFFFIFIFIFISTIYYTVREGRPW